MLQLSKQPATQPNSNIFELNTITDIEQHLQGEDYVVAWDIDDTLYKPKTSFFPGDAWFAHSLELRQAQGLAIGDAVKETLPLYIEAQHRTLVRACEPEVVDIIQRLQEIGICNFALTSRGAEVKAATFDQLESIGLNFNQSRFENIQHVISAEKHREVSQGVIFCSGGSAKGDCLLETFKVLNHVPKKLIFIDDKVDYLKSVQRACEALDIEFVGLRYGFEDEFKQQMKPELVAIQEEIFQNPILSDEEASVLYQARQKQKSGLVINPEKNRGLLWCAGDRKDLYDKICAIQDFKKDYRAPAKYVEVQDGHHQLCTRFKIPLDKLELMLPMLTQEGLIAPHLQSHYQEQIRAAKAVNITEENQTPYVAPVTFIRKGPNSGFFKVEKDDSSAEQFVRKSPRT